MTVLIRQQIPYGTKMATDVASDLGPHSFLQLIVIHSIHCISIASNQTVNKRNEGSLSWVQPSHWLIAKGQAASCLLSLWPKTRQSYDILLHKCAKLLPTLFSNSCFLKSKCWNFQSLKYTQIQREISKIWVSNCYLVFLDPSHVFELLISTITDNYFSTYVILTYLNI